MSQIDAIEPEVAAVFPFRGIAVAKPLLPELLWLAIPVLLENVLHMAVGWSDTFLASRLPAHADDATAAIGLVTYVLWLLGLLASAIGTGSTAIIARATGSRHRRLANGVTGQSITAAVMLGIVTTAIMALLAVPITHATGLRPGNPAAEFSVYYLRILGLSVPFMMLMIAANACLRGAGDSVTPAIAMVCVDVVNIVVSFALTRGWFGLPVMGFRGIAIGTVTAYVAGGLLQFAVLISGRGKVRLFWHRMRPHWITMKRVLRLGIPSGTEGLLAWAAQFIILGVIFHIDPHNTLSAAHLITIRIESLSFMTGLAFATAAATVVGQSLGMNDPRRAARGAHIAYALGGGLMTFAGICFILFRHPLSHLLSQDPKVADLAAGCLLITAFSQPGFAAALIYGGALRGAGDTLVVMAINVASVIAIRLMAVLLLTQHFGLGLQAIWIVLASELSLRGSFVFFRFLQGGWKHARV